MALSKAMGSEIGRMSGHLTSVHRTLDKLTEHASEGTSQEMLLTRARLTAGVLKEQIADAVAGLRAPADPIEEDDET